MSPIVSENRVWSADDPALLESENRRWEIWEGELVDMSPTSGPHALIIPELILYLMLFKRLHGDVMVLSESPGFLLEENPDTLLAPDIAVTRKRPLEKGWMRFAPEVAIEVLSPSNSNREMIAKRAKFFAAGTLQFWSLDPAGRSITVWHRDGRKVVCTRAERLLGEGILEGFELEVSQLFVEIPNETRES